MKRGAPRRAGSGAPLPRAVDVAVPAVTAVSVSLPYMLIGALAVQLREDLGLSPAGLGVAAAAYSAGAMLSAVLGGRMADRFGASSVLRLSVAISGVAMAGTALVARSLIVLVALMVVAGGASSLGQMASNRYLARTIDPRRLGMAFGVRQSSAPIASLFAGSAVPIVALTVGWRWAFAGGTVLAAASLLFVGRQAAAPARRSVAARVAVEPVRVTTPPMITLAVGAFFGSMSVGLVGAFLVDSAQDIGVANATAGWLVAAGSAIGLVTRLFTGIRADQRGGKHLVVVARMLFSGAALFALLAVRTPVTYVIAAPLAFSAVWGWTGLFQLAIVRAYPTAPGAASGLTATGSQAGSLLGPLVGGFIARSQSYTPVWVFGAVCSALGAAIILFGRNWMIRDAVATPTVPLPAQPQTE